jgi:hypothetical protein
MHNWLRMVFLVVAVCVQVCVSAAATEASIGQVAFNPSAVGVNTAVQVTVTVAIADPLVLPASVNLLRIDDTGKTTAQLGRMYDDGTHGDLVQGDGIYTVTVGILEPSIGIVSVQVSAALRGVLQRVRSSPAQLRVVPSTPAETLVYVSSILAARELPALLAAFAPSQRNAKLLSQLSPARLNDLSAGFGGATLLVAQPGERTYEITIHTPDQGALTLPITMAQSPTGQWVIVNW